MKVNYVKRWYTPLLPVLIILSYFLVPQTIADPGKQRGTPPATYDMSAEQIRERHEQLVAISAAAGGVDAGIRLNDAGFEAAEYLHREYRKAGIRDVSLERFEPVRWWPENWELSVVGEPDLKLLSFPLWYCQGTDNVELEVVYVGYGTPAELAGVDVAGKAVLIDMRRVLHFIPSYNYTGVANSALARGASALIFADTRIDSPSGMIIGGPGKLHGQPTLYPLPCFSIGKSEGAYLKQLIAAGPTYVKMNLEYSMTVGEAYNVLAKLPGNGKIDEIILVGGHYDTWFTGAIDNLGSQAALPEIAKYFARVPLPSRDRDIWFVSLFGHEFGNDAMGHAAFVEQHADVLDKITCFINVDGSGSKGYEEDLDGEIYETGFDDKAGIFSTSDVLRMYGEESFLKYNNSLGVSPALNVLVADQSTFFAAGLPTILIISKHIYYHSLFDTLEKITPDVVLRFAKMQASLIQKVLDSPPSYILNVDENPYRVQRPAPPVIYDIHIIPADGSHAINNPVTAWISGGYTQTEVIPVRRISWDFGDGTPAVSSLWPTHIYRSPGTYTITLKVTSAHGDVITRTRTIEVN